MALALHRAVQPLTRRRAERGRSQGGAAAGAVQSARASTGSSAGFALPLALVVALLLLLSSLAVQTVLWQVRSRRAVVLELRRAEDALTSAAHQLVGSLQDRHPCLLALALSTWPLKGQACATPADIDALIASDANGLAWSLLDWQPQPNSNQVELVLQLQPSANQALRRGGFRIDLDVTHQPPRVIGVRSLGLRGIPAAEL